MSLKDINPGSLLVDIAHATFKKIRNRPKAVARRAEKAARKAARRGDTVSQPKGAGMAIDIGTRTTTNMTVSGLVVFGVMKAISRFFPEAPTEGLEEIVAAVVAYVVGYFTKTPATPKVL